MQNVAPLRFYSGFPNIHSGHQCFGYRIGSAVQPPHYKPPLEIPPKWTLFAPEPHSQRNYGAQWAACVISLQSSVGNRRSGDARALRARAALPRSRRRGGVAFRAVFLRAVPALHGETCARTFQGAGRQRPSMQIGTGLTSSRPSLVRYFYGFLGLMWGRWSTLRELQNLSSCKSQHPDSEHRFWFILLSFFSWIFFIFGRIFL